MAWWLQEHDLDFLDTKSDKTIYGFMGGEWWWDVYDIDRALHLCFPKDSVLSWLIRSLRVLNEAFSSSVNRKILQENLSTHLSPVSLWRGKRVAFPPETRWRLRLEGLPVNSEMHWSCCVRCNSFLSKMKIKAECAAAEVFHVWDLRGRSCNGVSRTSCWDSRWLSKTVFRSSTELLCQDYLGSTAGDITRHFRNADPELHPFERAREYQRALKAFVHHVSV